MRQRMDTPVSPSNFPPKFTYEVGETLVKIEDVSLIINGESILHGVNATVRDIIRPGMTQGQIVGILGCSGSGKTSLAQIMTGLTEPTTGQVLVRQDGELKPIKTGTVGMVSQKYPLLRHHTVMGNLVVAARMRGKLTKKEAEEKANGYLVEFDMQTKADNWPSDLSGGQRQRIAIIQQLLCSEHFLVLDEPTSGLDPVAKDKVCDVIRKVALLHEENTIFVVSHDLASAATICDTIWLMGRGSHGASVVKVIDLIERGIAWNPAAQESKVFFDLIRELRGYFNSL